MTIRPETDSIIAFLNELAVLDPIFAIELIKARVPCNAAILNHPTVQAGRAKEWLNAIDPRQRDAVAALDPDQGVAGFLGVINGYCGSYDEPPNEGWGPIIADIDGDKITFRRTR
jgi:hypothetical protein